MMLAIPGATVAGISFNPQGVVRLRRQSRLLTCPCGRVLRAAYDRSVRRWRHLDLGASKLYLEAEIRRLECPSCRRVRTEQVPWATSRTGVPQGTGRRVVTVRPVPKGVLLHLGARRRRRACSVPR